MKPLCVATEQRRKKPGREKPSAEVTSGKRCQPRPKMQLKMKCTCTVLRWRWTAGAQMARCALGGACGGVMRWASRGPEKPLPYASTSSYYPPFLLPFPCTPGATRGRWCCAVTSAKRSLTGDAAHRGGPQGLELLKVHVAIHLRRGGGGEWGGAWGGSEECIASICGSNALVGGARLALWLLQRDVGVDVPVFAAGGRGGGGEAQLLRSTERVYARQFVLLRLVQLPALLLPLFLLVLQRAEALGDHTWPVVEQGAHVRLS